MAHYIIRFFEKHNKIKGGSFTIDSDEPEIQNIDDEKEVKMVIEKSFTLAINALNNKVKQLTFTVENYENKGIWNGGGIVVEEKLKITSLIKIINTP